VTPYYQDDAVLRGVNRLQSLRYLLEECAEPGTLESAQPPSVEASSPAAGFGVHEAGSAAPPTFEQMWATVQRRKS
jgi:hypothetical protein